MTAKAKVEVVPDCNCSARFGVTPRNMAAHEAACPHYFLWACGIVFKTQHYHSGQLRAECPGCLPAWQGVYRNMVSTVVSFHASRDDACQVMHVEIAAEKPEHDQIMVAYCCEGCGGHGAQGVPGAFREKVRRVREMNDEEQELREAAI